MLEYILKIVVTYILNYLFGRATKEIEEYKEDKKKQEELKRKVNALKESKNTEEFRRAIADLSI